ncbi:17813_t:CDS:2 [Entrophospora sp. SA101]|nr:17813_t:CDS:2 [Entrophospora sp. SA101]
MFMNPLISSHCRLIMKIWQLQIYVGSVYIDTLLTISPDDRKKASDLLGKNYLPNEILEILHTCKKAEIQCLCDKDDDDLLNYLTSKIKHPISWL